MEKKNIGHELKNTFRGAVESIKDIKFPEFKLKKEKSSLHIDEAIKKETKTTADETVEIKGVLAKGAIKSIYFLMAADGSIYHSEEEKFDDICSELYPDYGKDKEQIIAECRKQLEKIIDPEDRFEVIREGLEEALDFSSEVSDIIIPSRLFIWDLLVIAYSDKNYDKAERKLLKYAVRKLNIDKTVFLEMENGILMLTEIEKELEWIKTTDRPYLRIEAEVNEIMKRKKVIFDSIKELIEI